MLPGNGLAQEPGRVLAAFAILFAPPGLSPLLRFPTGPIFHSGNAIREETSMTACIVGWSHTPFGKLDNETVESLIVRVANEAMEHAGLGPEDIDEVVLGHFNGGFSPQDFTASLVFQASDKFRFKPATRVENACATGSAAVHQAIKTIEARRARTVLVVGVEQMTRTPGPEIGNILLKASYLAEDGETKGGFAGVFGQIAGRYFQRYGDQSDALAMIAAKNHQNGVDNPYAQMRKDLGFEFCRAESDKNPFVAGPLKRTDCSLVSDGAAALILADTETALRMPRAVAFRATAHAQDFLPMSKRDIVQFEGCSEAWRRALDQAGIALTDLSFVETHDCFTIAELIEYEAMGLTPPGQGATAVKEGWTNRDGKLPVNPSGGLKAKGHPIGATGVSMHALSAMQLCGDAGGIQVKNPVLGGIFNMGGAAVANYVSVLERIK
jgi:acetyl-CoA C-acetyltransferase